MTSRPETLSNILAVYAIGIKTLNIKKTWWHPAQAWEITLYKLMGFVFFYIFICVRFFCWLVFWTFFLTNLTKVSFVNRNNLAHCNIHSDAYRCSSPKSDLPKHTYIYKSYAYSKQFRGMVKKNSKSKNALIPSYVWVFWTERCHKGELFSHKKTNFFFS